MALQFGKKYSQKARPSYVYSIIGVALVLFMLGLLGIVVLNAQKLSDYFKENIEFSFVLMDNTTAEQAMIIKNKLLTNPNVKSVEYITKEDALNRFKENFKEDFMELIEYNPLYASLNFHVNSSYTNPDSIKIIEQQFMATRHIKELYYQHSLVDTMNQNAQKISILIIVIVIILFFIALALIDNTIKLVMYSNRFLIKSMQLVGATRWFISKPFIIRSVINGLLSSLIAIILLGTLGFYANSIIEELATLITIENYLLLFSIIILIGVVISVWSTYRSVTKYLKLKLDDLY
jgi:cell division transport system permease protein